MELVTGSPLLNFAEERALGTHEKLGLFALVCDAHPMPLNLTGKNPGRDEFIAARNADGSA